MHTSGSPDTALDYHAIFRAAASPHLVLDRDLRIVDVNDAFLGTAGQAREQVLGRYVFDVFPANPRDPDADGIKNLRASLERVLREGVADRMPEQKYDIPVGNQEDGQFEERYWSPTNTPVFDDRGNLTHIVHQVEDISARVRADASVRASERRFRALTNATADVVYRMSPDWKQMHQLDGRGFLKDTTVLADYRIEEYVHPDDLERARAAIATAIRDKAIFELEHRVVRADGSEGWTYSKAVPILDAAGEISEWIGSASDITERKQVEAQLMEADRRKDEFLAMLAHELRNPLAPISAAAQLLQLRVLDEARLRHAGQIIGRQVAHMTNLVDELLDVSRVARGLVRLETAALDMRQVVTDAIEQVTPLMQARRHHLEIRLPPDRAAVAGDRKRLVQILVNLLNNSAKFTHEGGKLQLHAEVLPSQVRIEVIDNGIGMAPETARHAFELFSQAERSSDRSSGGLGLGLALVKSLAELHGGSVRCDSEGLGKGSRFTVHLPRLADDPAGAAARDTAGPVEAPAASLRILVVDDNADAAAMLAMLLEALGHQVTVEHGAIQALERARTLAPQVCLLDIGLPGIDGNELAQRLRAHEGSAHAVLIAVTGYGQESDIRQSIASGFDHHLVKPVDMERLASILSGIVRS